MKKICVITTSHKPTDVRIYKKECLTLSKYYDITIIAPVGDIETVKNVNFILLKKSPNKLLKIFGGYRFFREAARGEYESYHFHDMDFLFWAWLLRLVKRKPVIYDVHEIYEFVIENRKWIPNYLKPFFRHSFNLYEQLFNSKKFYRVVAAPYQLNRYKDAVLIMNLSTTDSFNKITEPKTYKEIVYIGSITEGRVLGKVFEIAAALPKNYEIKLIGEAHDKPNIKSNKVQLLGYVENDKLSEAVGVSGIGIVPFSETRQFKYSVASKVFDYLALGLNVVAPAFIRESFGEIDLTENIIFVDGDAESFTAEILNINKDVNLATKRSKLNRTDFLDKYNWDKEAIKLLELYGQVFGK